MLPALFLYASLVNDVRSLIARHDLAAAEHTVRNAQAQTGATPEVAAALSWLGRAAWSGGNLNRAEAFATETRAMALDLLRTRTLAEPSLATALGASIEVQANVLAARGERAEAVSFLLEQLKLFGSTTLHERIRKNLNLLSLEGKPAPALQQTEWLGPKPPPPAALLGHPVLLFFWAHWCPDCKAEAPVLGRLLTTYGPKGLIVLGPTKLYGTVAGGEAAAPAAEKTYINRVRRQYYSALVHMPVPVSAANFQAYGTSTTPTLVLIDAAGIVRLYHPGAVPEAELAARIQALLK